MTFREQVAADITDVFLNPEEFAELHTIDTTELLAVVSRDSSTKRSGVSSRNYDGLHGEFLTVNFRAADYDRRPQQGENIKVDGKLYKVDTCSEAMGMVTLKVGAYRMGGGFP